MSKDKAPMEFWLDAIPHSENGEDVYDAYLSKENPGDIHVIDYSAYAEAVKMLEEMAGALESNNLWIKDLPSCDAAYVNNKSTLDNYRKWKEGMK